MGDVRVTIIGGSAAGLMSALLLARAGHEVRVLERDARPIEPDVETAAAAAARASAPQVMQSHVLMSRFRELLAAHLPDVHAALLEAGVVEASLAEQMPPSLPDRSARPGDERLAILMTRRSTIDWVLRRVAAAEPGVTVRDGVRVTGLTAEPGDPPQVTGVLVEGQPEAADVVVDASGRRTHLDAWLTEIGARPSAVRAAECGLAYYTRHYRRRPGAQLPGPATTRLVVGLDEFGVGIWGADHDTMLISLFPLAGDRRFTAVRDPATFTRVVRSVPFYAAWLDVLEPLGGIHPMGGLHNTLRRLVGDGSPVVLGLHPVGDVVSTTNPTMGRGLGLTLQGAVDLAAALAAHPRDPRAQAVALDRAVAEHVEPFWVDQAAIDAARLAHVRHTALGEPAPPAPALDPARVDYAQLRTAMPHDPLAFRAFWTVMGMLRPPESVYRDPEVIRHVHAVLGTAGGPPRMPQPSRAELEAALTPAP